MSESVPSNDHGRPLVRQAEFFEGLAELFAAYPEVRIMWGLHGAHVCFPFEPDRLVELVGGNSADIQKNATRIAAGLRAKAKGEPPWLT